MPTIVERIRELQREQEFQQKVAEAERERQRLLEREQQERLDRQIQVAVSPFLAVFDKFGIFNMLEELVKGVPLLKHADYFYKLNPKVDKRKDLALPELTAEVEIWEGDQKVDDERLKIGKDGAPFYPHEDLSDYGCKFKYRDRHELRVLTSSINCGLVWRRGGTESTDYWNEIFIKLGMDEEKQFRLDISGDVISEREFSPERIMDSIAKACVERSSKSKSRPPDYSR